MSFTLSLRDIAFLRHGQQWVPPDGLLLWYQADTLSGLNDNDPITTWPDASGGGNNATASGATRPLYRTNIINSLPAVRFIGTAGHFFDLPEFFSGTETAAEKFMLLSATNDPGINPYWGSWRFTGDNINLYPYLDGNVYEQFCSNIRPNVGSPSASLQSFLIYNIRSTTNVYIINWNGLNIHNSASNTFTTAGLTRRLGRSGPEPHWFDGYICEVMVFNRILTTDERADVWNQLYVKWGLLATENFEDYPIGTAVPSTMTEGINFSGASDIAENYVKLVSEETFESYPDGVPTEDELDEGTGWNGAPDVATNA
jgi:hypothetical protein